uniref:glycine-rich protein-like n=1 Tax=Erigeron canadensis TaxID=72917 RepID=UPI001CB97C19|nr:glycine-rich protein-like [Erigeron canadensis]
MSSKTFLFLALAFAVVLLITSEVAATREVAATHESVTDADYHHKLDGRGGYNDKPTAEDDEGGSAGDKDPDIEARCRYRCCSYSPRGWCIRCCRTYAEAVAFEQTRN